MEIKGTVSQTQTGSQHHRNKVTGLLSGNEQEQRAEGGGGSNFHDLTYLSLKGTDINSSPATLINFMGHNTALSLLCETTLSS